MGKGEKHEDWNDSWTMTKISKNELICREWISVRTCEDIDYEICCLVMGQGRECFVW